MRAIAAWVAVNALLFSAHVFGAATSWAYGTLLLEFAPSLQDAWWTWFAVGLVAITGAVAFLFWVVGFAQQRGVRHG